MLVALKGTQFFFGQEWLISLNGLGPNQTLHKEGTGGIGLTNTQITPYMMGLT